MAVPVKLSPAARIVFLAPAYLCCATAWVISAGLTATIVARRACSEGSAPLVFLEAFTDAAVKFCICTFSFLLALAAVLLCGLCLAYLVAVVSGSGSEFKKNAFRAITHGPAFKLPRAVVLGFVADLALILLTAAGTLVGVMSPHVEGSISQGQMIGSVIEEVGAVCIGAISCFVIIPSLALYIWSWTGGKGQADRKSVLTVRIVEA